MIDNKDIGYYEELINGSSIVRARTIRQIRSWDFPRSIDSLETLHSEFSKSDFPGIYLLFESKGSRVYIGEAKSVYHRLRTHFSNPEEKIKNWDKVLVIGDGRLSAHSDFNDNVIRLSIEIYLINLFKLNKYIVVAQGDQQILNGQQKSIYRSLIEELNFFLNRKGLIAKFIENKNEEEVMLDDLKKILVRKGHQVEEFTSYEAIIDNNKAFIRPGSKKSKGWQITFRDKFKNALQSGLGYLLVPRGSILFIPFNEIKKIVTDENAFLQNTIDIYVQFTEENTCILHYKNQSLNVDNFLMK
jgi:hypothetical protein